MLRVRLLGEIEVVRDGKPQALPPSRKTRALLGYLAATARPHRRERLCSVFWEIPDDPRGALRWSLSRLRALVDEPGRPRIVATREAVALDAIEGEVDLLTVRKQMKTGFPAMPAAELETLAAAFRGEFLEGIDLPDLHDFQAWCLAEREDLRRMQARILSSLIGQLSEQPDAALSHARTLVKIDPFNEAARSSLLRILVLLGRRTEAERHFDAAVRVFKELGDGAEIGLMRTWRKLMENPPSAAPTVNVLSATSEPASPPSQSLSAERAPARTPLVGRDQPWASLLGLLDSSMSGRHCQVAFVSGEPGIGKTALIDNLIGAARARGVTVLSGRAYETDRGQPYSPWVEAIGALPSDAAQADGTAAEDPATARERLFAAVAERVFVGGVPTLLTLDNVQWCDDASTDLLGYIVRAGRRQPLLVALTARSGEIADNPKLHALQRAMRQTPQYHEIKLSSLTPEDVAQLVRSVAPDVDPEPVVSQSGGNPLYALEIARSLADKTSDVPGSLKELVRDRVDRLPAPAAEVLTWASILGPRFSLERLTAVAPLALDDLSAALEVIERHELLQAAESHETGYAYRFACDLIHQAVYSAVSEPRRRLMHLKAARVLKSVASDDETLAADVAHHAGLAGEAGMAAEACVGAARRCLQLFANADAAALASKGQRYAERLGEPERVKRLLELAQVELLARRTEDPAQAIVRIEALAETALDHGCLEHARLGFHMLSHLRWEGGLWSDARRDTLRAEFVSRSADEQHQIHAVAEAARCLAMLERDLAQAEALALEASAMSQRLGIEPNAIADATGLLRLHQGQLDEAATLFQRARDVARRDGERTGEFIALAHLVDLELRRRHCDEARRLCADLVALSERLRDGSEAPFARAIDAVARWAQGDAGARDELERWLHELRTVDAKHRLSVVLLHAADLDIAAGDLDTAGEFAREALELVTLLDRASDIVLARSQLARISLARGDAAAWRGQADEIQSLLKKPISSQSRALADTVLDETGVAQSKGRRASAGRRLRAEACLS